MRTDLEQKRKPIMDIYESLVELKSRLDKSGKPVSLEPLKLLEVNPYEKTQETSISHVELSESDNEILYTNFLDDLKEEMSRIPSTFQELGRCLMDKRENLVCLIREMKEGALDEDQLSMAMVKMNEDTERLHVSIGEATDKQIRGMDKILGEIGDTLQENAQRSTCRAVAELQKKLAERDEELQEVRVRMYQLTEERESANKLDEEYQCAKDKIKVSLFIYIHVRQRRCQCKMNLGAGNGRLRKKT